MQKALRVSGSLILAVIVGLLTALPGLAIRGRHHTDLTEILSQMNEAAKKVHTVQGNLQYTKVTVLVDDKSTESGQIFFRRGKTSDIRIDIQKPEAKNILFRKNHGMMFLPKINQVQEYDLSQKSDLIQQFLLLGFGTDTNELKKSYDIKYLREEDLQGDTTAVLELTPRKGVTTAQITKIEMWISEESWLPAQQKFFEPDGDYLMATYSNVKVNRPLSSSIFELSIPESAKHVKMN